MASFKASPSISSITLSLIYKVIFLFIFLLGIIPNELIDIDILLLDIKQFLFDLILKLLTLTTFSIDLLMLLFLEFITLEKIVFKRN